MKSLFDQRRAISFAAAALPFLCACSTFSESRTRDALKRLERLEKECGGRLGVYAINTADKSELSHRGDETFPVCSTFKILVAAAILELDAAQSGGILRRHLRFTTADIVRNSPITTSNLESGMTVYGLCLAMLRYSDNAATNLLMGLLGGPSTVTAYARSIGDRAFRLDRCEPELNTAVPGDPRDSTSPKAMAHDVQRLLLGDALPQAQRLQLNSWMLGNTTSSERFRAAVPSNWLVADKTGTGDFGTRNDVGVLWPTDAPPLVVAVYLTFPTEEERRGLDVLVADATRIVVEAFRG